MQEPRAVNVIYQTGENVKKKVRGVSDEESKLASRLLFFILSPSKSMQITFRKTGITSLKCMKAAETVRKY